MKARWIAKIVCFVILLIAILNIAYDGGTGADAVVTVVGLMWWAYLWGVRLDLIVR